MLFLQNSSLTGVLHSLPSWGGGTTEYALDAIQAAARRLPYVCPVPPTEQVPLLSIYFFFFFFFFFPPLFFFLFFCSLNRDSHSSHHLSILSFRYLGHQPPALGPYSFL